MLGTKSRCPGASRRVTLRWLVWKRVVATSTVTPLARSSGRSSSSHAQEKEALPACPASFSCLCTVFWDTNLQVMSTLSHHHLTGRWHSCMLRSQSRDSNKLDRFSRLGDSFIFKKAELQLVQLHFTAEVICALRACVSVTLTEHNCKKGVRPPSAQRHAQTVHKLLHFMF